MKKFFTLIAMAFIAISSNAQTSLFVTADWGTTVDGGALTGNVVLNFKNGYASINLISEDVTLADYPSYELVLADDAPIDKLQFAIKSDSPTANAEGYNWSGEFTSTTPAACIPEGATKLMEISVQACNVENLGRVEIKSFNLIDKDGNKVATTYVAPPSWATDVLITKGTINYTSGGQWNFAAIKGAEGMALPLTLTVNADAFPSGVSLNVNTSAQVPNWNSVVEDRHINNVLPAGENTITVDLLPVEEGETIKEIALQNTVAQDPFSIANVTATIAPYVAPSTVDLPLDNLASGAAQYDVTTHTITLIENGTNKGWWFGTDAGSARDFSDYENVVIQMEATANGGAVAVEYNGGAENSSVQFFPGATCVVVKMDEAAKNSVKQIYLIGEVGDVYTLTAAFVAKEEATPAAALGTETGIQTVKAAEKIGEAYNIAGQRVASGYKGLVIVNGKKVIKK